jgi:hypothetical protein
VRTRLVQAQSGSSASFDHRSRGASGGAETEHAQLALVGELDALAEQRVREIVGRQPPGLEVQVLDRRDQRPAPEPVHADDVTRSRPPALANRSAYSRPGRGPSVAAGPRLPQGMYMPPLTEIVSPVTYAPAGETR